jgi:hypothetical protein
MLPLDAEEKLDAMLASLPPFHRQSVLQALEQGKDDPIMNAPLPGETSRRQSMTTMLPPSFFVFDVESIGLVGFAVGYVIVRTSDGAELDAGLAWVNPSDLLFSVADPDDAEWVKKNVPALPVDRRVNTYNELYDFFWKNWSSARGRYAWLAADCSWPVEARFLVDCISAVNARRYESPYPFIDIASVMLGAEIEPMADYARTPDELPKHNPLADARQSARLLLQALNIIPRIDQRFADEQRLWDQLRIMNAIDVLREARPTLNSPRGDNAAP